MSMHSKCNGWDVALVGHAPKEMSHVLVPLENSSLLLLNGFSVQYVFERKSRGGRI